MGWTRAAGFLPEMDKLIWSFYGNGQERDWLQHFEKEQVTELTVAGTALLTTAPSQHRDLHSVGRVGRAGTPTKERGLMPVEGEVIIQWETLSAPGAGPGGRLRHSLRHRTQGSNQSS